MATRDEIRLIEKMVRAKVALESGHVRHRDTCVTEDPDSMAPCTCGAGASNASIAKALRELSFEK